MLLTKFSFLRDQRFFMKEKEPANDSTQEKIPFFQRSQLKSVTHR